MAFEIASIVAFIEATSLNWAAFAASCAFFNVAVALTVASISSRVAIQ